VVSLRVLRVFVANLASIGGQDEPADWQVAIDSVVGRFGKLDVLVNNAGLFLGKDIEAASLEEWHRLCAVNLTGVYLRSHSRQGSPEAMLFDDGHNPRQIVTSQPPGLHPGF